jgi:hypothetical protein
MFVWLQSQNQETCKLHKNKKNKNTIAYTIKKIPWCKKISDVKAIIMQEHL